LLFALENCFSGPVTQFIELAEVVASVELIAIFFSYLNLLDEERNLLHYLVQFGGDLPLALHDVRVEVSGVAEVGRSERSSAQDLRIVEGES
jgi:hypothetical protein